ncbi:iron abc transporter substrate-binding protein [Leptolyngbya sp. Heron Island J]|uniref:ABC transporter substrate-binding protein n=1 Tax=Leptolyngbya sp. Heron Island J TaxID=1385935 RepID=UPI0003B98E62|nr:iron-siderophore ABC transporter substrate-binding protein [Leptolyngbya sp. Heron Island J]ESA33708.1 iron abc transporter substrate-binding protein [Leptolyngbya sp. Heron Island J]MDV3352429.1 iron-siderophore ABC transporter substrate-binding protein [Leptothoe sp. LEGE 181152]
MSRLKRFANWLLLSVLTISLIVGCGLLARNDSANDSALEVTTQPASGCRIVQHDLGETEICGQPQKVVTLSAHILDLLLSLDVQPFASTLPLNAHTGEVFNDPARQIPYLGERLTGQPINLGRDHTPSLEALVGLKPDLIVGEGGRNADEYELLSEIAPTLLWNDRTALGKWQESLQDLATALGMDTKAETVIQQYEAAIASARADLVEVVAAHPKLLLLGANRLDEGFVVIAPDSYLGALLAGIGFQIIPPPAAAINASTPLMSIEALPELNDADTIIVLGWNFDTSEGLEKSDPSADTSMGDLLETHQVKTIQQDWQTNSIAQSLTASQENRVYFTTFYKWNGLNGPIGAELILEQLRQFFLTDNRSQ